MITIIPVVLVIAGANLLAGISLLIRGIRAQRTRETVLRRKGDFIVTGLRLPIGGELARIVGRFWAVHGTIMVLGGLVSFFSSDIGLLFLFGGVAVFLIHDLIVRIQHKTAKDRSD